MTQYALLFVVVQRPIRGGEADEWRTVQVASSRLLVNALTFVVVFRRPYTQVPMPYF